LTGEILDKFSQLITTALGLVAALAWNDAIQTLFQQYLGTAGGALAAKIFYAVLVTVIVIVATIAVSRGRRAGEETRRGAKQGPARPRPLEGIAGEHKIAAFRRAKGILT
jgi:hypothetical protein